MALRSRLLFACGRKLRCNICRLSLWQALQYPTSMPSVLGWPGHFAVQTLHCRWVVCCDRSGVLSGHYWHGFCSLFPCQPVGGTGDADGAMALLANLAMA